MNRQILCPSCQATTKDIDRPLAHDRKPIAAHIGVENAHSGPISATAIDPATGSTYVVTGTSFQYPEPRETRNELIGAERRREMVCSTQAQRDEYLRALKGEGKPYSIDRLAHGAAFRAFVEILEGLSRRLEAAG